MAVAGASHGLDCVYTPPAVVLCRSHREKSIQRRFLKWQGCCWGQSRIGLRSYAARRRPVSQPPREILKTTPLSQDWCWWSCAILSCGLCSFGRSGKVGSYSTLPIHTGTFRLGIDVQHTSYNSVLRRKCRCLGAYPHLQPPASTLQKAVSERKNKTHTHLVAELTTNTIKHNTGLNQGKYLDMTIHSLQPPRSLYAPAHA